MSTRDLYPDDIERVVNDAAREASTTNAVRWDTATPTEAVLARWVIEARAAREARQVRGEDDPGEAAREQARTPGNAHRRRVLNALLAAWDAHPDWTFRQLLAATAQGYYDGGCHFGTDAETLAALRALVKG